MIFLADENLDFPVVDALRQAGYRVLYIREAEPGIDDAQVLSRSTHASAIVITSDKDFGELIFKQHLNAAGIILLRLSGLKNTEKAALVLEVINTYSDALPNSFTVVSAHKVRIRKIK